MRDEGEGILGHFKLTKVCDITVIAEQSNYLGHRA